MLTILVLALPVFPQKIWESDLKTWNREDTSKLINNSPWAVQWTNMDVALGYNRLNDGAYGPINSLAPAPPVILRLYSSLTLRKGLLRLRQLQAKYDEMSDGDKYFFDKDNQKTLACDNCRNYYVFILFQPMLEANAKSLVADRFREETLETLRDKVFLVNDKGEKRVLGRFDAPKGPQDPAIFYFPIADNTGKQLIESGGKKVVVQFKSSLMPRRGMSFLEDAEFNLRKMLIDGKLDLQP